MTTRRPPLFALAVGAVLALVARVTPAATISEIHYVMGTYLRIDVVGDDEARTRAAMRGCFTQTKEAEERFTRFDAQSELSKLNAAGGGAERVSPEMAALLQRSIDLRVRTAGSFNVAAGALTALWRDAERWPSAQSIERALASANSGLRSVAGGYVRRAPGTIIDLDGIAKGWAVDQCVSGLQRQGVVDAVLSFGESSVRSLGRSAELSRSLLVRGLVDGESIGEIDVDDGAISVSAVFGHERNIGGRRVGHIVDPHTGLPLERAALAVAFADSATAAEAFSKALLIAAAGSGDGRPPRIEGLRGGIVVTEAGVQHFGAIAFRAALQPLPVAAEPLR